MERRKFTREFKLEAVRLIKDRGVSYAQASQDLGVHQSQLRDWVKKLGGRSAACLPRPGADEAGAAGDRAAQARGHQAQGRTRHPKKSRGLLREGIDVKFGFIAKHRGIWPADWMCEALGVSRGGFYAWLTRPRSKRSRSDEELGAKVRASFLGSDRTYGARRVWHDLAAEGVSCGLHRIERLMRLQALKARPRRRRLPPDLGERQAGAVAPNVLDRGFEAPAPNRKWIADFTYVWTAEGWLYVAAVDRSVLAARGRLVDERRHDGPARHRRSGDGDLAARQARCAAASLRSRQPIQQRTVPAADGRSTASSAR